MSQNNATNNATKVVLQQPLYKQGIPNNLNPSPHTNSPSNGVMNQPMNPLTATRPIPNWPNRGPLGTQQTGVNKDNSNFGMKMNTNNPYFPNVNNNGGNILTNSPSTNQWPPNNNHLLNKNVNMNPSSNPMNNMNNNMNNLSNMRNNNTLNNNIPSKPNVNSINSPNNFNLNNNNNINMNNNMNNNNTPINNGINPLINSSNLGFNSTQVNNNNNNNMNTNINNNINMNNNMNNNNMNNNMNNSPLSPPNQQQNFQQYTGKRYRENEEENNNNTKRIFSSSQNFDSPVNTPKIISFDYLTPFNSVKDIKQRLNSFQVLNSIPQSTPTPTPTPNPSSPTSSTSTSTSTAASAVSPPLSSSEDCLFFSYFLFSFTLNTQQKFNSFHSIIIVIIYY